MIEPFSLLGGPLHGLACRAGLVRGGTNTTAFGVVLGAGLWIVLVSAALIGGFAAPMFSLSKIAGHVRLLVVIPLLFYAEALVDPRFAAFVGTLVRSRVVPEAAQPAFDSTLARVVRWKDSWVPDVTCLVLAMAVSLTAGKLGLSGATSVVDSSQLPPGTPLAVLWYWSACLALFRFLMLRWIWRLGLWAYLLWRISKLDLNLVPTHPDGAAGLGYLEVVQSHFAPMVLAISALQAASLAEELAAGTTTFSGIGPAIAFTLMLDVVLFIGPLYIFFVRLWNCQVKGLRDYMEFASDYVSDFDSKYLGGRPIRGEVLLGTADLQSLADLNNSIMIVRNMRLVPWSPRLVYALGASAVAPMLPLLLFKYPLAELAAKFVSRLTGF